MLLFTTYTITYSQDLVPVKQIEINADGTVSKLPKYLEYDGYVQFKINNVNNLIYSADILAVRTNQEFDIPAVFQELAKGIIEKVDTNSKNGLKELTDKKEPPSTIETFEENYLEYQKIVAELQKRASIYPELLKLLESNPFINDATAFKEEVRMIYEAVYDENSASDNELFEKLDARFNEFKEVKLEMNRMFYNALNNAIDQKKIQHEMVFRGIISIKESEWNLISTTYAKLSDETVRKELLQAMEAGRLLYAKIERTNFVLFTPVLKVDSDMMRLTPKLYSKKDTINIKGDYVFRSRGGFKVNFSAGYLLSFRGDENFDLVKDTEGNSIGVKKGNTTGLTHALGGLVHIYPRGYRNLQPGFSLGISSSDDGDLGFHAGLSLLATESKNRIVLSAGVSFISLQKLNQGNLSRNEETGNLEFRTPTDTEIRYDEVYQPSFFAGLTFNLGKTTDEKEESK